MWKSCLSAGGGSQPVPEMPFLLRNLSLLPEENEDKLLKKAASVLGIAPSQIRNLKIVRKAVDARKKPRVLVIYTVSFSLDDEPAFADRTGSIPDLEQLPEDTPVVFTKNPSPGAIVIAGMGPAGLFCALRLAQYDICSTIIERGRPVEERVKDVARFWREGLLDSESNVQFGEGGAGTFSDGKLTCRLRDPNSSWVVDQLIRFGAPPEIRFLAKPHVGTDRLRKVVVSIRKALQQHGCDVRFSTSLNSIASTESRIRAVHCNSGQELPCSHLVLAIGHSARDTYRMLAEQGLPMEPKPFAIGLRVEHPQELIDRIQYGRPHPALPKADYALTYNNRLTGRSCYSFCMCPGGVIIGSSSEPDLLVVNGMSNLRRDSGLANSALVTNVRPDDFDGCDPLSGVRFQQHWERLAFEAGGSNYMAPGQNLLAFMGLGSGPFASSCTPGVVEADLALLLPDYISATLKEGIESFGRKMKGFVTREATLTGVETRTSAPLRIIRGDDLQSPSLSGLYPCGEGAGYAGGIISAALDGVRVADRIAGGKSVNPWIADIISQADGFPPH